MALSEDNDVVQAIASDRTDGALAIPFCQDERAAVSRF
jgi:hypothetical protein